MRIFQLSYFFLPTHTKFSALNLLNQCLHFDPDFVSARRLVKKLAKLFAELESLQSKEDWRGIGKTKGKVFAHQFDEAMEANTAKEQLLISDATHNIPLPRPDKIYSRQQEMLRSLCSAYVQLGDARNAEKWCLNLLGMDGWWSWVSW
jgi:hypothetical protein